MHVQKRALEAPPGFEPNRIRVGHGPLDQFSFPFFLDIHIIEKPLNLYHPIYELLNVHCTIEGRDVHF